MKVDEYGQVSITEAEAITALYNKTIENLDNVILDDADKVAQYNWARETNADRVPNLKTLTQLIDSVNEFDIRSQNTWFMPDEYKNMDIEEFLITQCPKENYKRILEELTLFHQFNMIDVLRYLKYLVDTMRKHKIVWGVGRGSSVASYCLFLIGVHRVDSVLYQLDIKEFLK